MDFPGNPVGQFAVSGVLGHIHCQGNILETGSRNKLKAEKLSGNRMDLAHIVAVRACLSEVQRFRGAAVCHFSLHHDMGLVDMPKGYVGKWGQFQAVKTDGKVGRVTAMGHEDLDPAV